MGTVQAVLAKIDTVADGSVIPGELVISMGLIDFDKMVTISFDGREERQLTYLVDFLFAGRIFTDIEVVTSPISYALLGRDILNQLVTKLDGPRLVFEILS
jgi:hypothetical protein